MPLHIFEPTRLFSQLQLDADGTVQRMRHFLSVFFTLCVEKFNDSDTTLPQALRKVEGPRATC
jgi:hypothetical protein